MQDYVVETDGVTIWVNGSFGAVGRLGPRRMDIHNQDNTQCADCGSAPSFEYFCRKMKELHGVDVPEELKPEWAK